MLYILTFRKSLEQRIRPKLIECAVLSTCARLEIIFATNCEKEIHEEGEIIKAAAADFLAWQISHRHQGRIISFLKRVLPLSFVDKPSRIRRVNESDLNQNQRRMYEALVEDLKGQIVYISGVEEASTRLCLIAAGLLDRKTFRPFSARDQHVMKQLKTTLACARGLVCDCSKSDRKGVDTLKIILDSALVAGKGARSPKTVPILDELRQASSGADGPPELSKQAADSAKELAVEPAIRSCVVKLKARQASDSISFLREETRKLTEKVGFSLESSEGLHVRSLLHQPLFDLRNGKDVDIQSVLKRVELQLQYDEVND